MLMTEEEAGQRWCPLARDSNTGGNRTRFGGDGSPVDPQYGAEMAGDFPCIGSQCMAWRWDMTWASATEEGDGGDMVVRLKRRKGEPKRGGCGLAGQVSA